MNTLTALDKLQHLYHYLHGAHSVCDHDNSSATFHHACHKLDEIINDIKANTPTSYIVSKEDLCK